MPVSLLSSCTTSSASRQSASGYRPQEKGLSSGYDLSRKMSSISTLMHLMPHSMFVQHVRIETVLGAAKYIVETYLETKPQLPEALHQAMRNPQLDARAMEVSDDYLTALHEAIDAWRGPQRYISFGGQPELIDIVSAFLQYCEHALRDWRIRQWQMSRSAARQAAEPANSGVAAKEQTTDNMTHDRDS